MLSFSVSKCPGRAEETARELLLSLLSDEYGDWGKVLYKQIYKNQNGKPLLPCVYGVYISISHSRNFAAAAIADSPVGVDVEEIRPLTEKNVSVLERYFAGEDTEKARTDPTGEEFYRFWTRREAAFKAYATRPFYTEDPVKGREESISTYIQKFGEFRIALSVACTENKKNYE